MKPISARASYNDKLVQRLFSPKRAQETSAQILTARANSTGHILIAGINLRTSRGSESYLSDKKSLSSDKRKR